VVPQDWLAWHRTYDDRESSLARRLEMVRGHVRDVLDARHGMRTRIISACAGDGRDVIDVAVAHPARDTVDAYLIEATPPVAEAARTAVARSGLARFTVVEADAGVSDVYAGLAPADLLLFCGVFGWIDDADVGRTIDFLPRLAAPGATVIWTLHHRPPDRTGAARARFRAAGFAELAFAKPERSVSSIGVHRLVAPPQPFEHGARLFTFPGGTSAV
jgi:hypothetical protein